MVVIILYAKFANIVDEGGIRISPSEWAEPYLIFVLISGLVGFGALLGTTFLWRSGILFSDAVKKSAAESRFTCFSLVFVPWLFAFLFALLAWWRFYK